MDSKELRWLMKAATNDRKPEMEMIVVMENVMITTDGYRMHVLPNTRSRPEGYYVCNRRFDVLIKVDSSNFDGNFFESTYSVYEKEMGRAGKFKCSPLGDKFTNMVKIHKNINTVTSMMNVGSSIEFMGVDISLSMNGESVSWHDDVLHINSKYLHDAYSVAKKYGTINMERNILIAGRDDGPHAIIMGVRRG